MRVLIADDDRDLASMVARLTQDCGHEVVATVTTGGLDVLHLYDQYKPDVVCMDVMMPRFNGITISRALQSKNPAAKIILFSGKIGHEHPLLQDLGNIRFLQKPIHLEELREALESFSGN
jgi:DNA-binding response OmpR family regulator